MMIERDAAIRVRPAGREDIPLLQGLLSELHAQHYEAMPERFLPQAAGESDSVLFGSWLANEKVCLLVAERASRVVAYARAELRSPPDGVAHRARTFVEVHEIVVAKGLRRSGVGRLLMQALLEWAESSNASSLELSVYAFNEEALDFYRRIGMKDMRITLAKALE